MNNEKCSPLLVMLNFNIEKAMTAYFHKNRAEIKLFFILFVISLIAYGQALFFYSLSTDDFARYYSAGEEQASFLGRWMAGIFNQHILTGSLHILPYFNTLIGIFSFSLAAFLSAKFLKIKSTLDVSIFTLLIVFSPMFAHNLYFHSNTSTWITTLLGIIALRGFYKPSHSAKIVSFVLLVIAIGAYQTIIQVVISMVIISTIIDIIEVKTEHELRQKIVTTVLVIALISLAFLASNLVNYLYMEYNHLATNYRYKRASNIEGAAIYISRLVEIYSIKLEFLYFKDTLVNLYKSSVILSFLSCLWIIFKRDITRQFKLLCILLIVILFAIIPLIINLPMITGNSIPIRAHYALGWLIAEAYLLLTLSTTGLLKTINIMLTGIILITSTFYINVFFEAGSRQTAADISRVNQIVNRIRMDQRYANEPLKLHIEGEKSFPVIGWKSYQQGLNTGWSKYKIFSNFTDLKFTIMSDKEYQTLMKLIISQGQEIKPYPAKNAIYIDKNNAVLFLDTKHINALIKQSKR